MSLSTVKQTQTNSGTFLHRSLQKSNNFLTKISDCYSHRNLAADTRAMPVPQLGIVDLNTYKMALSMMQSKIVPCKTPVSARRAVVVAAARPMWYPGATAPKHLNGTMGGSSGLILQPLDVSDHSREKSSQFTLSLSLHKMPSFLESTHLQSFSIVDAL